MKLLSLKNFNFFFSKWSVNILLFFSVAVIVYLLQFNLLKPALDIGFSPDDWELYLRYKSLGEASFTKINQVWTERGIYTTYQIYYMGLLDFLVGYNHRLFQTINIIFKIIAILSLYPLIQIIFKRRMLTILTVLLFAISYSSVGPLEFPVKGSDYVAISFMGMFLIIYYLAIKKGLGFTWLIIDLMFLILSMIFSPIRMFPLLTIPFLIEIYLLIKRGEFSAIKKTFMRLIIFYLPFILIVFRLPNIILGAAPLGIISRVIKGDWYLLLSPISGIGYTFIGGQYWGKIFGLINTNNLQTYISFLLGGPLVIYGFLTIIFAFLQSKRPWRFFIVTFALNFVLEILVFFIAFNYRYFPIKEHINFESTALYSILFGIYILVLSTFLFVKFLKGDQGHNLIPAIWAGGAFLTVFTVATWAFAPSGTNFSGTSYYLVVSCIGTSLFLAAFFTILYDKVKTFNHKTLKFLIRPFVFVLIIPIFLMSAKEINDRFQSVITNGRGASQQIIMQQKARKIIGDLDYSKPHFFYFDTSEIGGESTFYLETILLTLPSWMHFQEGKLVNGCLESFYERKQIFAKLIQIRNDQKGFVYRGLCVDKGEKGVYYKEIFYTPENLYAFKLKNRELLDIKSEFVKELGF